MPRARDRGVLDAMELWSPRTTTSRVAPIAYFTIARTFEQIDRAMLDEIQDDILRRTQPGDDSTQRPTSISRFNDLRAHKDTESYVEDIMQDTSHTSSETDVVAYLNDTKCLTAWSWVQRAVLEHQGESLQFSAVPWTHAKARADEILNLAQGIMETYCSDECQDLIIHGGERVGAGIEAKLRTLLLFDSVYSRPTYEDTRNQHISPSHRFKLYFDDFLRGKRDRVKARRNRKDDRTHQNVSNRSARPKAFDQCCKLISRTTYKA